ncbi:MAG: acetyltransferase [Burkholderiales bacterium]
MTHFDVFNGDADGICALLQLRLDAPVDAVLVTGAKRDIALLARVAAQPGDAVTVLDVSLAANRDALVRLLNLGATVRYFDHHYAGEPPVHPGFDAHLDPSPSVCTGILVDRYLDGRQRLWAIVAAYGDNLNAAGDELAATLGLTPAQRAALRDLGDDLTYNATGDGDADAVVPPADLYRKLRAQRDPFRFIAKDPAYAAIDGARRRDIELARQTKAAHRSRGAAVHILPDAPWARRVRGIFGNELANAEPAIAHAVLTPDGAGRYIVSVRAPRAGPRGADALCRRFAGGGRQAAAGIEALPQARLPEFLQELERTYPAVSTSGAVADPPR